MRLYYNLQHYQRLKLFSFVRNSRDMISVCLYALEYLQYWEGNKEVKRPYLCLDPEGTHRLYLVDVDKIISFGFDIRVKLNEEFNRVVGLFIRQYPITSREISEARQILSNNLDVQSLYCYNMIEEDSMVLDTSLRLFEHLIFHEWGYVRYDFDPSNASVGVHPVNHFDVNFTKLFSYKLGLSKKIELEEFINMIDKEKDCRILGF